MPGVHERAGRTFLWGFARHGGLLTLLLLVASLHGAVICGAPDVHFFGDEPGYLSLAYEDARRGDTSLLPGALRFAWRPELASRFYAQFAGDGVSAQTLLRHVSITHLLLLLALITAVYAHALSLGLRRSSALVGSALLGLFPWHGFYVHALWPEIFHCFLLSFGLLATQLYLARWHWRWLVLSGLFFGYAMLCKGSINLLMPVILVLVACATFLHFRGSSAARAGWHSASALAALAGSLAMVVAPQLIHNVRAGEGMSLAANRWINLELGLVRNDQTKQAKRAFWDEYFSENLSLQAREFRSRERVLQHLRSTSILALGSAQGRKLGNMMVSKEPYLERAQAVMRWGKQRPAWLGALNDVGRVLWFTIIVLGLVGLATHVRKSVGWLLMGVVVGYFSLALLAIPIATRFAMPLIPVLCVFAGAAVEWGVDKSRAPGPGESRHA